MGVTAGVAESSVEGRVGVIGRGVKVGRGVAVAISRTVGVAVTSGIALTDAVGSGPIFGGSRWNGVAAGVIAGAGFGVSVDLAGALCFGRGGRIALGASTGEKATDEGAGVDVDLEGGEAVVVADAETPLVCLTTCAGFTKVLGGGFGGGVDSDFILARTFSAA